MGYGANFYNEGGYKVFDGSSCMYEKASGDCWRFTWSSTYNVVDPLKNNVSRIQSQSGANSVGQAYYRDVGLIGEYSYYVYQSVSNTYTWYQKSYGGRYIMEASAALGDITFVNIPAEGLLQLEQINNKLPEFNTGTNLVVATLTPSTLQYKIFSPDLPISGDSYGMQLFNKSGNLTFDSRKRLLGVEFFEITSAQSQDILLNDAIVDLTLSKPIPNAMVSSPLWMNYTSHSTIDGCGRWIKITQTSDTNIRLSRQSYGSNRSLCDNALHYFSDLQLLVTRNE